jgi:uncharacterized protein
VLAVAGGLLMLSVVSGTLGLGVVFATVPFLGLFMSNLVDQVQPLSLLLNGITALFAAFGFARSHLIDWRRALGLAEITTAFAPLGALLAHVIDPGAIWSVYLACVRPGPRPPVALVRPARPGVGADRSERNA